MSSTKATKNKVKSIASIKDNILYWPKSYDANYGAFITYLKLQQVVMIPGSQLSAQYDTKDVKTALPSHNIVDSKIATYNTYYIGNRDLNKFVTLVNANNENDTPRINEARSPQLAYTHFVSQTESDILVSLCNFTRGEIDSQGQYLVASPDIDSQGKYVGLIRDYLLIRDYTIGFIRGDVIVSVKDSDEDDERDIQDGMMIFDGTDVVELHGKYHISGSVIPELKSITEFPIGYWNGIIDGNDEWIAPKQLDIIDIFVNVSFTVSDKGLTIALYGSKVAFGSNHTGFRTRKNPDKDSLHVIVVRNPTAETGYTFIICYSKINTVTAANELYKLFLTHTHVNSCLFTLYRGYYLVIDTIMAAKEDDESSDQSEDEEDDDRVAEIMESDVLLPELLNIISQYDI